VVAIKVVHIAQPCSMQEPRSRYSRSRGPTAGRSTNVCLSDALKVVGIIFKKFVRPKKMLTTLTLSLWVTLSVSWDMKEQLSSKCWVRKRPRRMILFGSFPFSSMNILK